jgi:hypothetical protein
MRRKRKTNKIKWWPHTGSHCETSEIGVLAGALCWSLRHLIYHEGKSHFLASLHLSPADTGPQANISRNGPRGPMNDVNIARICEWCPPQGQSDLITLSELCLWSKNSAEKCLGSIIYRNLNIDTHVRSRYLELFNTEDTRYCNWFEGLYVLYEWVYVVVK